MKIMQTGSIIPGFSPNITASKIKNKKEEIAPSNNFEFSRYSISFCANFCTEPALSDDKLREKYLTQDEKGKIFIENAVRNTRMKTPELALMLDDINDKPQILYDVFSKKTFSSDSVLTILFAGDFYRALVILRKYPDILEKLLLQKNNFGKAPVHNASAIRLSALNKAFKDDFDTLSKFYFYEDDNKESLIHYIAANEPAFSDFIDTFYKKPEFVKKLLLLQNKDGNTCAHFTSADGIKKINSLFAQDPDFLAYIYSIRNNAGETPILTNDEKKIQAIVPAFKNHKAQLVKSLKSPLKDGTFPLEHLFAERLKLILEIFDDSSCAYELLNVKNKEGTPLVFLLKVMQTSVLLDALEPYQAKNILSARDANNDTVLHLAPPNKIVAIRHALNNYPEVVAEILCAKNKQGKCAYDMEVELEKNNMNTRLEYLAGMASCTRRKIDNPRLVKGLATLYPRTFDK